MELHILYRGTAPVDQQRIAELKLFVPIKMVKLDTRSTNLYKLLLNGAQIQLPAAVLFKRRMDENRSLSVERHVHINKVGELFPLIMNAATPKKNKLMFDKTTYSKKYIVPYNANVSLKPQSTLWQQQQQQT
uniref:Uncharacterized protein n=1 Tax=Carcinus maenas virus 1 TaxID=2704945 RepID=A0A6G9HDZ9_9VIRU|nr:hypothetical protein [Carcinus maenas virus 1]